MAHRCCFPYAYPLVVVPVLNSPGRDQRDILVLECLAEHLEHQLLRGLAVDGPSALVQFVLGVLGYLGQVAVARVELGIGDDLAGLFDGFDFVAGLQRHLDPVLPRAVGQPKNVAPQVESLYLAAR